MKRRIFYVLTILLLGAFIRLWLGVYTHDEFGGAHLFIKHRPIWKWSFYSPIGMSDLSEEDLTPEKREEQRWFHEFATARGMSR